MCPLFSARNYSKNPLMIKNQDIITQITAYSKLEPKNSSDFEFFKLFLNICIYVRFFTFIFICLCVYTYTQVGTCHGMLVEVRGQHAGAGSVLPSHGSRGSTSTAKLRSKCPWLLSHFMEPHKETLLD